MKKFFSLALATVLTAALAVAASAEFVSYTEYPETPGEELVYATGDMDMLTGYNGTIGTDLFNLSSGGSAYCLKGNTCTWYDFEVSEKTDVTFYVGYVARDGSNRGLDWSLDDPNGEKRVFMDIPEGAEQQWVSDTFTVEAGKHSFYLYAPTNMDDSTLKSCDVYTIELYGAPAAAEAASTEAPAAEAASIEVVLQDYPTTEPIADPGAGYATLEEAAAAIGKTPITGYTYVNGSTGFANEGPEKLWDNDTATKFCTADAPISSIAALDGEYAIDGIIMATANDNAEYPNRAPFEWCVYGSADGATWTPLAYGDDYFFEDTNFTYYAAPLTTEGTYKYVMFQSENGLSGTFQVSEVVLTGTKAGAAAEAPVEEPVVEEPVVEEPVVEEPVVEEPVVEEPVVEEPVVEEPVVEEPVVEEVVAEAPVKEEPAPQTFDFGIAAALASLISAAGFALTKKR